MEKVSTSEMVDKINSANIASPHFVDEVINMDGVTKIETIDLDEHRWYVVGTIVFKVGEEFFGVSGAVSLKSESMDYSDCGVECTAFEMEQIPSVTYRAKQ